MSMTRTLGRLGWGARLRLLVQLPGLLRLHWRLLRDGRVPRWPKALLGLALLYIVVPVDLVPDALPFVGQLDDVVILIAAMRGFLRLCPQAVVHEHVDALGVRLP